jgi:hypothetical protein
MRGKLDLVKEKEGWNVGHDQPGGVPVQRQPPRVFHRLPRLLEQLIHLGIAVTPKIILRLGVKEGGQEPLGVRCADRLAVQVQIVCAFAPLFVERLLVCYIDEVDADADLSQVGADGLDGLGPVLRARLGVDGGGLWW